MKNRSVNSMEAAIYQMAHGSTVQVGQGADLMGMKSSYLYRLLNIFDTRASFPAVLISPAMQAFKNVSPLSWLNSQHGYIAVKPPRTSAKRQFCISDLQLQFAELFKALLALDQQFVEPNKTLALQHLHTTLKSLCTLKVSVQQYSNQLELF